MEQLLIIEDDIGLNQGLSKALKADDRQIISCQDLKTAKEQLLCGGEYLILLDIMMPKMDGYEACRKIREKKHTPIIMLTARAEEVDKVLGLEMGADDYVTKPFGVRELMARVKANLRKVAALQEAAGMAVSDEKASPYGKLSLNLDRYEVKKDGKTIDLTLREFELLKFLAQQKGQVFSRETLLEKVWGYEYFGDVRTVDVTVRRLREKIEDDPGKPAYILTKRGVGYYFDCD